MTANGLTVVGSNMDGDGLNETANLAAELDVDGEFVSVRTDLTNDADVETMVETAARP